MRIDGSFTTAVNQTAFDEIQLYHYRTRSQEEFQEKLAKGTQRPGADSSKTATIEASVLAVVDAAATENCTDALRYLQPLAPWQ